MSGLRIGLAAAALAALGSGASAQGLASMSPGWTFREEGGEALYAHVCAACHQPDGQGAIGAGAYPALAGNRNLASTDYVVSLLLNGQRGMPAVGQMMKDAQIAVVVNYARTHFGAAFAEALTEADVKAARARLEVKR